MGSIILWVEVQENEDKELESSIQLSLPPTYDTM